MPALLQFPLHREDRVPVAPPVQADLGNQPPEMRCLVGIADLEPCRLKHGCMLLAEGTVCGAICFARISSF
jgi:hypothetical protein